jgi:hypothetical protein
VAHYGKLLHPDASAWEAGSAAAVAYAKDVKTILTRAKVQPRQIVLDKLLMMFCASGNSDYLALVYEIGGDLSASEKLRASALDSYTHIRQMYEGYILEQKIVDHEWIANHPIAKRAAELGVPNPLVDSVDAFAEIDRLIEDHLRALERDMAVDEKVVEDFRKAADGVSQKFAGTHTTPTTSSTPSTSSSSVEAVPVQEIPKVKKTKKQLRRELAAERSAARKTAVKNEFSTEAREEAAHDMATAERLFEELASKLI